MIIYTATNTKTGRFYIGSALTYNHYMSRRGKHHTHPKGKKGYYDFHTDLQADPLSFKWEWHEDGRNDRSTEKSLIALYQGSPYLYNIGEGNYVDENKRRRGWSHTNEARQRQSEGNKKDWENNEERRRIVSQKMKETNSRRVTCEHCGKETNPANYGRWHKGGKCQQG